VDDSQDCGAFSRAEGHPFQPGGSAMAGEVGAQTVERVRRWLETGHAEVVTRNLVQERSAPFTEVGADIEDLNRSGCTVERCLD